MKLGIYNQHTSNQKRTKFYQNRTIIDSKFFRYSKKGRLKILIISNFNCPMTILNHGRHRLTGSFCYPYNHSSLTVYLEKNTGTGGFNVKFDGNLEIQNVSLLSATLTTALSILVSVLKKQKSADFTNFFDIFDF